MNHAEAQRLLRPHTDGTVSVPVLYDTEREALAYVLAELDRQRARDEKAQAVAQAAAAERVRGLLDRAEAAGVDALSPRMIRRYLDDPDASDRAGDRDELMAELDRHRAAIERVRGLVELAEIAPDAMSATGGLPAAIREELDGVVR